MQCDAHHGDAQRRHCDQHALAAARFGTKDSAIAFPLAPHPPVSASADRCADRRALRPIRRAPMGYGVSNDAELLRVDSLLGKRRFGGEIELVYVAGESHHSRDSAHAARLPRVQHMHCSCTCATLRQPCNWVSGSMGLVVQICHEYPGVPRLRAHPGPRLGVCRALCITMALWRTTSTKLCTDGVCPCRLALGIRRAARAAADLQRCPDRLRAAAARQAAAAAAAGAACALAKERTVGEYALACALACALSVLVYDAVHDTAPKGITDPCEMLWRAGYDSMRDTMPYGIPNRPPAFFSRRAGLAAAAPPLRYAATRGGHHRGHDERRRAGAGVLGE